MSFRLITRPLISQTLALDTDKRVFRALNISNPKFNAVIIAEIKLRDIAMQMSLAAMLIDALHAALEDAEKTFNSVRVHVGRERTRQLCG